VCGTALGTSTASQMVPAAKTWVDLCVDVDRSSGALKFGYRPSNDPADELSCTWAISVTDGASSPIAVTALALQSAGTATTISSVC